MGKTRIDYAHQTWNVVTGCSGKTPGCVHCWARTMVKRFPKLHAGPGVPFSEAVFHKDKLKEPKSWKTPSRVLVSAMGDVFDPRISDEDILTVIGTMHAYPQHRYLLLTKQAERMALFVELYPWSNCDQIWFGVSVEGRGGRQRLKTLLDMKVAHRWLSYEPAIQDLGIKDSEMARLHWIVVGGENDTQARPMRPEWAKSVLDKARKHGVPFYFKQWGLWFPRTEWEHNPELDLPDDEHYVWDRNTLIVDSGLPTQAAFHRMGKKGGCRLEGEIYHEFPVELMLPGDANNNESVKEDGSCGG